MRLAQVLDIPSMIDQVAVVTHPTVPRGQAIQVTLGIPIGLGPPFREDLIGQRPQAKNGSQRTIGRLEPFRHFDEMGVVHVDQAVAQSPHQRFSVRRLAEAQQQDGPLEDVLTVRRFLDSESDLAP